MTISSLYFIHVTNQDQTSLPKVIWEEGRVAALSDTYAVKSTLVTMGRPKFAPKSTPSRGPIAKPHHLPHCWTVRPTMPNGIEIRSSVFPQCTGQTDRPTDRSFTGKFDDYRRYAPRATRPNNNILWLPLGLGLGLYGYRNVRTVDQTA